MQEKIFTAAKYAYESAKSNWELTFESGGKSECIIQSSDIFYGLDLAGLPSTEEMENAVEDALNEKGYNAMAEEAYNKYVSQNLSK